MDTSSVGSSTTSTSTSSSVGQAAPASAPDHGAGLDAGAGAPGGAPAIHDGFDDPKPPAPVNLGGASASTPQRTNQAQAQDGLTLADATKVLEKTPEGKGVLADMDALGKQTGLQVQLGLLNGGVEGQYEFATNTIVIDPTRQASAEVFASTLSHELTHASQHAGFNPERDGAYRPMSSFSSAEAYADHLVEMEARAEARGIEVLNALGAPSDNRMQVFFNQGVAWSLAKTPEGRRNDGIAAMTDAMNRGMEWGQYRPKFISAFERAHGGPAAAANGG
ncbi:MAG TPA: DUF6782 family putative metallopeptidase [Myxococcales bacterium]|nr:DUF6782 family putative metallopeptidase [Myxococcales bacterium]